MPRYGLNLQQILKSRIGIISRASIGNYAYNNVASSNSYLQRATQNSILTNLHSDFLNTGFIDITEQSLLSDYNIEDASFFKIDNITLGYRLPKDTFKGIGLRLYGSVQNVLTVTGYNGLDPEISAGIDNNFYPRPTSYIFGVNIDF